MKLFKDNYHNSQKEISIYELHRDLSIISYQQDLIEFVQNSMILSFILPYYLKLNLDKKHRNLRQEWICLEFFIAEKMNAQKTKHQCNDSLVA